MPKRYAHIIKDEVLMSSHKIDEVTHLRINVIYECGKIDRIIREDPLILDEKDEKRLAKQEQKLRDNFPETCPKCRKKKDKIS